MCGRYWLHDNPEEIAGRYGVRAANIRYEGGEEIFPSYNVPVVLNEEENKLIPMKWGFPVTSKKGSIINARSETIDTKYMFKKRFLTQRCLIPANAFFEWKREGKEKIRYRFKLADDSLFSMAGIFGIFTDASGKQYNGFVIITTAPNGIVSDIHNRMPAILPPHKENFWIDNNLRDPLSLKELLKPYENEEAPLIAEEE